MGDGTEGADSSSLPRPISPESGIGRRSYNPKMTRATKGGAPPEFITPMAARPVSQLPEGPEWLYELKLDGYRALLLKNGAHVEIRSRNNKNLTGMYPMLAAQALQLKADTAVIDGEIVALDESGRPSFQALQHRSSHPHAQIVFFAFDLLHLDGRALLTESLTKRRKRLAGIVGGTGLVRRLEELTGSAPRVVQAVRSLGLEGVVAKRWDSAYQPGQRSADWAKLRLDLQQEFVVGGYRPAGSNSLDALLVGYYEGKKLRFAGKVRAGLIPTCGASSSRNSNRCTGTAARSAICRTRSSPGGAVALPPRKCTRCDGRSRPW